MAWRLYDSKRNIMHNRSFPSKESAAKFLSDLKEDRKKHGQTKPLPDYHPVEIR